MYTKVCKWCSKEITFDKKQQFGAHLTNCDFNTNRIIRLNNLKNNNYSNYKLNCNKCNKEYELFILKTDYIKGKYRKNCSSKCSNSRNITEEHKTKTSITLLNKNSRKVLNIQCKGCNNTFSSNIEKKFCGKYCISKNSCKVFYIKCKGCDKTFTSNKEKKFCNINCVRKHYKDSGLFSEWGKKGGLKSTQIQSETRRSKNEIYFFELCSNYFKNVENNKNIFNGWDADVIIHDIKVAVLWNGKWHYEKITHKHSVKQVQNRDRIKISEIINYGYNPYIIKDMGKYNKKFVESQFIIFIENYKTQNIS